MLRVHNPPNRFHGVTIDWEEPPLPPRLVLREEHAKTILQKNDSPDIAFSWSLNPYRGCTHACIFCYARTSHEYFDLSAGTDFERILFVKRDAPALLEAALRRPSWAGEPIAMSGITDCYQPIERKLEITRGCLEVLSRFRNPVSVITRSPLVVRDLDLLVPLGDAARVQLSIPIGDAAVCRALEPGTAPPAARLRAIRALADAGVPVGVSVAPVIPGLTDHLIPQTLAQAQEAGARWAWMSMLRLPGSVEQVFTERLRELLPLRAEAVLGRIRQARGGALSASGFFDRMRGQDETWRMAEQVFRVSCARLGLADRGPPWPDPSPFRRPGGATQLSLFPVR